jgi:hypothetical protein
MRKEILLNCDSKQFALQRAEHPAACGSTVSLFLRCVLARFSAVLIAGLMILIGVALTPALALQARAAEAFYVAPNGSDANPGTMQQPFRTVQHAAAEAKPGDTINIEGGAYCQRLTITASGNASEGSITFRSKPGETAILDGSCLTPEIGDSAMITIHNASYIKVEGLEVRNYKTADRSRAPFGIRIYGHGSHIELLRNNVHNIEQTYPGREGAGHGANGFGIAVYGTDTSPITDLVIAGNEVHDLQTGSSESLVLNGNVTHFRVTGNRVHNNNNIGIDIIGFEHTAPNPKIDRARDGVVSGNTVYDITSKGNPAYRQDANSDGIYVDGGTDVVIERNIIHNVDFGIETASEHYGHNSSHILVRNNLIYSCHTAGITIGGYDLKRGGTHDVTIVNNTLYKDHAWHTGTGEFQMQYHMKNNVFKNNIVYIGKYGRAQKSLSGRMDPATPTVTLDHNLYYFPAGPKAVKWAYDGKQYSSFQAYGKATGQDKNSIFADPKFIDPAKHNLHLQNDSPAIGRGANLSQSVVGTKDLDGHPRTVGGKIDIGCYQKQ